MAKDKSPDIEKNYSLFLELVEKEKFLNETNVHVNNTGNNSNFFQEDLFVYHTTLNADVDLFVVVKKNDYKYFQFKLRYQALSAKPFFRYDNDGPAHRNTQHTRLSEQIVTTPHFNTYDKFGKSVAYKTDVLNEQADAVSEIEFGFAHFCNEAKINTPDQSIEFQINVQELPLKTETIDPNENVKFEI